MTDSRGTAQSMRALSAVAFAITGTKWNGHRFFGVRHRDGVRASERKDDAIRTYGRERPSVLARGKPINRPLVGVR